MELDHVGRLLLLAGAALVGFGLLVLAASRLPFLGKLPGDLTVRWDGGSFYFPIVTCLVLSVVLSVIVNVVLRLFNRT